MQKARTCKWKINHANQEGNNLCKQKKQIEKATLQMQMEAQKLKAKNNFNMQIKRFGKRGNGKLSLH